MPECPTCEKRLDTDVGVKMHHKQVHGESIAGVDKVCDNCGKKYTVPPTREEESRFCSMECLYEGETHENNIPEKTCKQCGESFKSYEHKFCSQSCYGDWISENKTGENHPRWCGGSESYRGKNWEKRRWETMRRDNYTCQECGIGNAKHIREHDTTLHVHHIKPFRKFDSYKDANKMNNLVTLCASCHQSKPD